MKNERFTLKAPIKIKMLISIISIDEPTRIGTVTYQKRLQIHRGQTK